MADSFFALCVCAFAGGDGCLTCNPGELLIVYRVEKSGWAGAQSEDGRYGWMPSAYAQHIGDEAAAVLEFLAPEFRLGAYRDLMILQGTATNTMEGYASPDSDESDALGEEWTVAPKYRVRLPLALMRICDFYIVCSDRPELCETTSLVSPAPRSMTLHAHRAQTVNAYSSQRTVTIEHVPPHPPRLRFRHTRPRGLAPLACAGSGYAPSRPTEVAQRQLVRGHCAARA